MGGDALKRTVRPKYSHSMAEIFPRGLEDQHNYEPLQDQELNRKSIINAVKRKAEAIKIFTVHGYLKGSYTPLIFCLLKDKKKPSYSDAMRLLKDECEKRQLHLQPLYIVIDFEQALHECIVSTFPQTKIVNLI
uniref:MULE transposase domain-containing protein n=1 Tax=Timema poppense TaxID=170557 RepID=A0A7R9D6S9_TIMPO|nr:unnamed protein product [Timema poppensis]